MKSTSNARALRAVQAFQRLLPAARCVDLVSEFLHARRLGTIEVDPRQVFQCGGARFTVGLARARDDGDSNRAYGRVSIEFPAAGEFHMTVLAGAKTGEYCYTGEILPAMRNGAVGALAVRAVGVREPLRLAVIGSGLQAAAQVACITATHRVAVLRCYSPHKENRSAFVRAFSHQIDGDALCVESATRAAEAANVIVCATSGGAILRAHDLPARVHINAIGPKRKDCSELDAPAYAECDSVFTDNLAQLQADWSQSVLHAMPPSTITFIDELTDLGVSRKGDKTVFMSRGLTGAEGFLLSALVSHHGATKLGVQAATCA